MAINLKMRDGKWIINIKDEEWYCDNDPIFKDLLNQIVDIKIKHKNPKFKPEVEEEAW